MPQPLNIQVELNAMEAMTPKQLREKYLAVLGESTRSGNRRFMIKRIAWRLQADAEGDLPDRVRRKALELARDGDLRTTAPRSPTGENEGGRTIERPTKMKLCRRPTPGTQLTRTYKGKVVAVTVLTDGYAYAGTKYRSLSAVAKAVTGTHLSGNAFFGLARPRKKEAQA